MDCIAIWCSSIDKQGGPHTLEVHFNLWKLGKKNGPNCFLDVGLMIQDAAEVSHVNIFIPQPVATSDIEDLGTTLRRNPDLVSTLFNEDYRISLGTQEKTVGVLNANRMSIFSIYVLDLDTDVSIENAFGGSIIKIRIPPELADEKHYYRIRLKNPYVDSISHIYTPANSILESAFSRTELVDFRINEKRNLNSSLLERIHSDGEVNFSKTHLFLMREASDDYVHSHKPPHGSRRLEADLWKNYICGDRPFNKMIAYHWKETDTHHSFSAFAKFRYIYCTPTTISIFVVIIVALGFLSGFLANLLS